MAKSKSRSRKSPTKRRKSPRTRRSASYGRKKIVNSGCAKYSKIHCGSVDPNCTWVVGKKQIGCKKRKGALKGEVYQGPSMLF